MLSPETVTRSGTGARPGNLIDQPDVVPVAVNTKVVGVVSPLAGTERTSHLPATSARLTGAGAGAAVASVVAVVVEDAIALVVSTVASFFFAHPARTTAMQQLAMRVVRCSVGMGPPVQVTDGFRSAGAERNERKAGGRGRQAQPSYLFRTSLRSERSSFVMRFDEKSISWLSAPWKSATLTLPSVPAVMTDPGIGLELWT
jgi:hypothetical protein